MSARVCQVQLCLSVLQPAHTDMSHSAASRAARPIPKGVTGNVPYRVPLLGSSTMGPEPLLSPMVSWLHSHRTAEYCVRYSRAGGMKVLKCGTATPSCSDAWTQESSRIHSHLPESRLCALGSSRIHSHLHEARKASTALLGHRGYTRISTRLAMLSHQCSVRGSASPRTFANAHHSHFLFTVTRHSSATSPSQKKDAWLRCPRTRHA